MFPDEYTESLILFWVDFTEWQRDFSVNVKFDNSLISAYPKNLPLHSGLFCFVQEIFQKRIPQSPEHPRNFSDRLYPA